LGLTLDESKDEKQLYTINEIELLIDDNVLPHAKESQIDYISNSYGEGFSIAATSGSCASGCSGC
jgi:Fe-S cluster assembly iron-binding protein IscA